MTQKGRPNILVWTEDAVRSFKVLKDALTKAPVLIALGFSRKFIVQTDASDTAVGAVLSQTLGGEEHAVAYLSRKLLPREQKYATIEKECLAIVLAIDSLRYCLSGTTFEIVTDHNPLTWFNQMQSKNQRLLRWCLALQPYNFIIKHRSGKQHGNADALSRM
ncbi:hypothetical protein ACJMK2_007286 [Sinanodonta woodiana]|uniref:Reverse transcriptase RNase H-like domain-containing protein n=1 Tax=Sinanodonta woodiana TaxID=1069815 RepID=A0ABD3VL21_SINWO